MDEGGGVVEVVEDFIAEDAVGDGEGVQLVAGGGAEVVERVEAPAVEIGQEVEKEGGKVLDATGAGVELRNFSKCEPEKKEGQWGEQENGGDGRIEVGGFGEGNG